MGMGQAQNVSHRMSGRIYECSGGATGYPSCRLSPRCLNRTLNFFLVFGIWGSHASYLSSMMEAEPKNDVHFPGAKESSNIFQSLSSGFPMLIVRFSIKSGKPPAPSAKSGEKKLWQLRMALKSLVSQVPLLAFQLPIVPGESAGIYGNSEASLVETTNQPMMCPANTFPPIWSCARPPQLQSAAKATVYLWLLPSQVFLRPTFFRIGQGQFDVFWVYQKLDPSPT